MGPINCELILLWIRNSNITVSAAPPVANSTCCDTCCVTATFYPELISLQRCAKILESRRYLNLLKDIIAIITFVKWMITVTKKYSRLSKKLETNISIRQMLNLLSSKSLKLLEMKASQKHIPRTEEKRLSLKIC